MTNKSPKFTPETLMELADGEWLRIFGRPTVISENLRASIRQHAEEWKKMCQERAKVDAPCLYFGLRSQDEERPHPIEIKETRKCSQ